MYKKCAEAVMELNKTPDRPRDKTQSTAMIAKAKKKVFEASRQQLEERRSRKQKVHNTSTRIKLQTFYKWLGAQRKRKRKRQDVAVSSASSTSQSCTPSVRINSNSGGCSRSNTGQLSSDTSNNSASRDNIRDLNSEIGSNSNSGQRLNSEMFQRFQEVFDESTS